MLWISLSDIEKIYEEQSWYLKYNLKEKETKVSKMVMYV